MTRGHRIGVAVAGLVVILVACCCGGTALLYSDTHASDTALPAGPCLVNTTVTVADLPDLAPLTAAEERNGATKASSSRRRTPAPWSA